MHRIYFGGLVNYENNYAKLNAAKFVFRKIENIYRK